MPIGILEVSRIASLKGIRGGFDDRGKFDTILQTKEGHGSIFVFLPRDTDGWGYFQYMIQMYG
ncbi:hypothetical protein GCM10011386_35130 [Parapedobacter defluvii]|uniref:Uncharacterized protein n=1 Tax=Parapedobacter defluvii TaxID=2045106 RepID=A0ABQ1MJ51_9SPHI|nr:hypothetical protein [Parapedobacter defluvii]GGC40025.1 hypothetical protein GCM10011386_35130 [Parapedobacter defluvii]